MKPHPVSPMKFLSQLACPFRSFRSAVGGPGRLLLPALALALGTPAMVQADSATYSGIITYNGVPVPGVRVEFGNQVSLKVSTTGTDGKFAVSAPSNSSPGANGNITPTKAGYTFKTTSYTAGQGANGVYGFNTTYYGASTYLRDNATDLNFTVSSGPKPTLDYIGVNTGYIIYGKANTPTTVLLTGIGRGDDSLGMSLVVSATSSDPSLVPNPTVTYTSPNTTGVLRLTPSPGNTAGSCVINVTVTRSDGVTFSQGFTYSQSTLNVPPSAAVATALELNGTDQYVDVPDGVWFGNTFTVEGWVYLKSYANWSRFFDFGNGEGNENVLGALSRDNSGKPVFAIYQGAAGTKTEFTSPNAIPLNTWTHLAFVREANGVATIYLNGALMDFRNSIAPNAVVRTNNFIGRSNWKSDSYADGSFADFRIWNTGRTAAEILATKGVALPPSTPGLVLNYRFNEGLGSVVTDLASLTANPDQGGAQNGRVLNDAAFIGPDALLGRYVQLNITGSEATRQVVVVPNYGNLVDSSSITVEFWQKVDAAAQQSSFSINNSAGKSVNAHVPWEDGRIYWDFGDIAGKGRLSYLPAISPVGQWNHFAFVSDFQNQVMKVYRNGALEASKAGADQFLVHNGDLQLRLGGRVADFRIWNMVRSQEQIRDNRFAPVPSNANGLVLNFLFDETSGTTVTDRVSNGGISVGNLVNGATLSGAVMQGLATSYGVSAQEDNTQFVYLPGVDLNGAVTYSNVGAANGTLTQISGGNFLYRPKPNTSGSDTITYSVSDGASTSTSSLKVGVAEVNDPPVVGPGTALAFDGVDDQVTVTNSGSLTGTFTVEAWARPDDATATLSIMGSRSSKECGFDLKFDGGNKIHADIGNGTGWLTTQADVAYNYAAGVWVHLAYVVTPTGYTAYVNGSPAASGTFAASDTPVLYDADHLLRLGTHNGNGEFFKGRLADVRIWNTARTAAEINANLGPTITNNTPGLVGYYRLNEGAGLTAFDSATGNGAQNASLLNGPVWQPVEGPAYSMGFSTASGFNQFGARGKGPDPDPLDITGPLTIEAWIYPAAIGSEMGIVNKYGATDGGYGLVLKTDGKLFAGIYDNTTTFSGVTSASAIPANVWTHVAMRWNGTLLQVFINGVLDATTISSRNPKAAPSGLTPLLLATDPRGRNYKFNGRIGDLRIWKVARTDSEIYGFRGGVVSDAAGLVVNYLFNEGSGNVVNDVATGDGEQDLETSGSPDWTGGPLTLAMRQTSKYTEDTARQFLLAAFDIEGNALTYSGFGVSTGSVAQVTGNLVSYSPPTNYNGRVTLSYTVSDGTSREPALLYLRGIAVDDPPTLDFVLNNGQITVGEGSSTTDVVLRLTDGDPELEQNMSITARSSNPALMRDPIVDYQSPLETGKLKIKPRPGMSGTNTITVTVTDLESNQTVTKSFLAIVTQVDDPPNAGPATALAFNGNNYVSVPGFGTALDASELTIEFWQYVTNTAASSNVFQLAADNPANRLAARVPAQDGRVYWEFGDTSGGGQLIYTPPVPILGKWQHFAFVASRSGNYMKIFRNGIEEATKPGLPTLSPGTRDLRLGLFAGQLAEFRVWKVARTSEQLLANLNASLPNDTANLVAYYRFNQKPTTILADFASAADQNGAQNGVLVPDNADVDPVWQSSPGKQVWQSSDPDLKAKQVMIVPNGSTNRLFLPAWDAENGITTLVWKDVAVSPAIGAGSVTKISGGLYSYAVPSDYSGHVTIAYTVQDTSTTNAAVTASVELEVVVANNDAPTISQVPNQTIEESSALVEIPFTVDDDQPAANLEISATTIATGSSPDLIQSFTVPAGGNYRTLNVVPKPGVIGTVHVRIFVKDQGSKTATTEFDLRVEPKPAFSVIDLGILSGKTASFGTAINDQGAVAGYMTETVDLESNPVGFFYSGLQNGGIVERNPPVQIVPNPAGTQFRVWAMNNSYALAGSAKIGSTVAWVKGLEDSFTSLGTLSGGTNAVVRSLNAGGALVGTAVNSAGKLRAFSGSVFSPSLTTLELALPPYNDESEAYGINVNNHIVGAIRGGQQRRAAIYQDGLLQPLFTVADDTNSVANGINAFDQVVGRTTVFAAGDRALKFDGVDDQITQTNLLSNTNGTSLVAGNAAHTVEAWIKVAALPANRSWPLLLGNAGTGAHHWLVNKDNGGDGGALYVGIFEGGGVFLPLKGLVGAWLHVAATYDPPSSKLVVYLNGQPFGTNTVAGVNLQGIPLTLGLPVAGENYFNGSLDELRVWRTTRTAAEVAANYTRRLTGTETGLVVYYPFDEPTGSVTTSEATGALVATLTGSPVREVRGGLPSPGLKVSEPALQFDGVSSRVVLPSLPLAGNSFTVEFWARRAGSDGTTDYMLGQGTEVNQLNRALHVGFRDTDKFTFAFFGNDLNTAASYKETDWHHWACTFNATNLSRKIYRDGVEVAADTATSPFLGTGPLMLGRAPWDGGSWFKGALDDVRVWNVARSAADIAANINRQLTANTSGLLAYYHFDEGGGNVTVNHATGVADASLQGAVNWIGRDSGSSRGFLYEPATARMWSLGTVDGGGASVANAINDFGQVAGTADKGLGQRAFFHSAGRLNDLNDLLPEDEMLDGWTLESGNAINRNGAIAGTGTHGGLKRAFLALPATVIGRPVIRPQGAVDRIPVVTLLKTQRGDDTPDNSFYWSQGEKLLYAIRPVTAKIEWYTSFLDTTGTGTNTVSNTNKIVSVSVNVWPKQPIIHVAGAPVDMQPAVTAANYTFQSLIYVTNRANVEPSAKVFTCPDEGYTVAFYLKNDGLPLAITQPPYFEVIRTVKWNDYHAKPAEADCFVGQEVTDPLHAEYDEKNGYVLFEKAAYDAFGPDHAYDRGTRLGPILPVNLTRPGGNTNANPDDLVVVWYRTNRIGVAWASVPVRYSPHWPADNPQNTIVIASQLGSGFLDAAAYPGRSVYNQPDITQPGFNPNEEHAYLPVDTLYAIRDDLNDTRNFSRPYSILKYRDPITDRWKMRVFKVVAEEAPYFFRYSGTVGKEVQPPLPLSLLPLSPLSYQQPPDGQIGWEDYKGKFYARQAGPDGTHADLLVRWFYPMQPSFYHPDERVTVGSPVAWLDRRKTNQLAAPNHTGGISNQPIDVTYDIQWDDEPVLQIGETLLKQKHGLPNVFDMASAQVIFNSLNPQGNDASLQLARFYDPISARTIKTGVAVPSALLTPDASQAINGKVYFRSLPWMLKIRLSYDPVNNWLSFGGYLDANFGVGEPLLLPNVLSDRERKRIIELAPNDSGWVALVNDLYNLTRNPNGVHLDPNATKPDVALRLGLTMLPRTNFTTIRGERKVVNRLPGEGDTVTWVPVALTATSVAEADAWSITLPRDITAGTFRLVGSTKLGTLYTFGTVVAPENLGAGPKALTAGLGGVAAAAVKPGNMLSFTSATGVVEIGSNDLSTVDLDSTPFTIEFWAKVSVPAREQYLLGQAEGSPDLGRLRMGFRDGGKFAFDLGTTPATVSIFNTSTAYADTNWHHWAGTFDPETKVQQIFRDGVAVASRTNAALSYQGFGTVELGRFGSGTNNLGANQYFVGKLDEIRIWKTARTGAEIRAQMNKRQLGSGVEPNLEVLYRCDETAGPLHSDALAVDGGYDGTLSGGVSLVPSDAPTGIPPRYLTLAENNDPALGLPVALHVIRVDDGPFLGDLKVLPGDNIFDERLTMRHSSDFGGDPGPLTFQWYYKPIGADFDPTDLPIVTDPNADDIKGPNLREWIPYSGYQPKSGQGVNYITTGEGGESGLITISDNAFICRYKGYAVNLNSAAAWSGWVGDPAGTADQPRAALAEGWVKRVLRGLNPFDSRISDFHESPAVTYASMVLQAGPRYEGPIAFNPSADAINKVGLIEAYSTVLDRAKGLSIEGVPQVDFNPANNALLLAATKISDLYTVLGNEAYADASDPTIGFSSDSQGYGSLASSIFAFQNQLDSLLEEELTLLRGRDDSAAGVGANPVYNRLFWNFTLGEGEVAYQQNYNVSDQDQNGFIDEKDARILYPQGHGDAWGHYLMAIKQHYNLLRHPYFTWIPRSELVSVAGAAIKVDYLDERKFAKVAAAKAKAGAEIVDLTYRLNYVDDPAGQWQGYKDTKTDRAWGVTEWARRTGMGAYFDWLAGNTILPSTDPNPAHTGIDRIDRQTVRELEEIPAEYDEIQKRLDQADAGLNPLGLAKGVVPFDIDPSLVSGAAGIAGKTHYEQIQDRALKAMQNALAVWDEVNKSTVALRKNQDSVEQLTENVDQQERDYKNRLIELYGYPYAGDIGAGKTYPSGYDGPDLYHYMYVPVPDLDGNQVTPTKDAKAYFTPMNFGLNVDLAKGTTSEGFFFPKDFAGDLTDSSTTLSVSNRILTVIYPQSAGKYTFNTPASYGQRRAQGEIQLALSDLIQSEARLRVALQNDDALFADIDSRISLLKARYAVRAEELKIRDKLTEKKVGLISGIIGAKIGEAVALRFGKSVIRSADAGAESLPKSIGLATDATSVGRAAILFSGAAVENSLAGLAGFFSASAEAIAQIGVPAADGVAAADLSVNDFSYEINQQVAEIERVLHELGASKLEGIRLVEAVNQASGRYLATLSKAQRLLEERVAFRIQTSSRTTENRYQDMTFRIFRNDALQKYRATFDLAQRYVFLAATAYDYESNLLGTDTRSGRNFLTDIIRQRSIGQMLNGSPVIGRSGLADPLARMGHNFDVLKTQLGFNNPQTETGRFSLRNELFRLRDSSADDWRAKLATLRVTNLWDIPEFRRYCRSFAPESAGPQPGLVIRFPTTVTAGQNFFAWPLGGGDSAYDSSRFATKIRSAGVWFTGYNGLGLSQTPRVYLVPAGSDVLSSPTPNDFVTRGWRVVDQAVPVPFPIGSNRLNDPSWIPVNDSLGGSFAEIRRFSSFRAFHDSGGFSQNEVTSDSRLIGRSVWNTDWVLIIPGQTFLANPNTGLDAFLNSVSDIKLFFQTYSYSGN